MDHDLNRVRYDLALSYAQEKLRYALEHGVPERIYPDKNCTWMSLNTWCSNLPLRCLGFRTLTKLKPWLML